MSVYATVNDVAAKWGRDLTGSQAAQVQVLLDEAEALLLVLVPGLADALTVGTVSAVLVRKVLTDAVLRPLRNPAGVQSQTVGPESVSFFGQSGRAEVGFLPAELAMVTPPSDGISADGFVIGSVRLGRPDYCSPGYGLRSEADRCW